MQRRAMGLEEIPMTGQTHELAPASAIRMTVGADIPEADPTVIRTCGMRAEMAGGVDLAATTTGQEHPGWRCSGRVRVRPTLLRTQLAIGLASEARKWLRCSLGSGWLRRR